MTEPSTLETLSGLIQEVIGEDWSLDKPITPETSFNRDLELESIEFVALAEKLAEHYGDSVDFVTWLANMELEDIIELRVGEVVSYIDSCR